MKLIIILFMFFSSFIVSAGPAVTITQFYYKNNTEAIKALNSTNVQKCHDAYYSLFTNKKKAIPFLIENAACANTTLNLSHLSYYYSSAKVKIKSGILSLYLIECILHNRTQPHNASIINIKCDINGNSTKDTRKYDYTTQTNVAAIYQEWWDRNKNYLLAEIRERDINPLEHTQYQWEGYTQHMHLAEFTFTNKTVIPEEYPKVRKSILERLLSIFH